MDNTDLQKIQAAATNVGAAALLAFQTGRELAENKANMAGTVHRLDDKGTPFFLKHDGSITKLEEYAGRPAAVRGRVEFHDGESFAHYVNAFKDPGSIVFADRAKLSFVAVLDYHVSHQNETGENEPRWGKHRASFKIQPTDEWIEWTTHNGKEMTQTAFGQWFEDRLPDILEPDGAIIVEMARRFEAKKDVTFSGRINPDVGSVSLIYTEDVSGTPREGGLDLPRAFKLKIEPFQGAQPVVIDARIRFRVTEGKVLLRYELIRHKHVLEAAFDEESTDIKTLLSTKGTAIILAGPEPGAIA
jgi:uncharacterized protein YfdQ (DUF2303 family)